MSEIIRQCYDPSELIETGKFTLFQFGSEGYAIENSDYVDCCVTKPYYKYRKGYYWRCYANPEPLNQALRIEKQREWYNSK